MELYYHKDPRGNFGDDLNVWLWDQLLPGWQSWDPSVTLIGVGTLLNARRLDSRREDRLLILGSGAGYREVPPPPLPASWDIRAVRGPRTAQMLSLPEGLGILDPAMLIPMLDDFRHVPPANTPLFVPHVSSIGRHDWAALCQAAGMDFISPSEESQRVIRKIAAAPLVLAESLHAAILADSFRIPWIPVSVNEEFNTTKWQDWALSLQLDVRPQPLFPLVAGFEARFPIRHNPRGQYFGLKRRAERIWAVKALRKALAARPLLSSLAVLNARQEHLLEVMRGVTKDYGGV